MLRRNLLVLCVLILSASVAFAQGRGNGNNGNGNGNSGDPQGNAYGVANNPTRDANYLSGKERDHWCLTEQQWEHRRKMLGKTSFTPQNKAACPTEGSCDLVSTRDATSTSNVKVVDIIVHVMRDNNGNNGVSQATVDATVNKMNQDFTQSNIQLNLLATRFHNNSQYACISAYSQFNNNWYNDIQNMKSTYAESVGSAMNIFISCQDSSSSGTLFGIATFPWDPAATTATGGLWLNNIATGASATTATHEVGHNLGLWHTHHGVSEVSSCSSCYEYASGFEGDVRGDFCSDTPPTPTNYNCSGPGGSDCQGTSWGSTQPQNFMGYGPDSCHSLFTPQQTRRMHCWTSSALSGFLNSGTGGNQAPNASFTYTPNNLSVSFNGNGSSDPDGSIVSYAWSFGDGNTGSGATPSHTYGSAGTYTVTLTVTDNDGASDSSSQSVTVTSGGGSGTQLNNGDTVSNLSNSQGQWQYWTVNIPSGATNFNVSISGGTGDADLYTRYNAQPTLSSYNCRPWLNGNNETCTESSPTAGTWHIAIYGYSSYSGVTLSVNWTDPGTGGPAGGGTVNNISRTTGNWARYYLDVPSGMSSLEVDISGGTGDADLYTRFNAQPTTSSYNCRPYLAGNNEDCTETNPAAGRWYIGIRAYSSYSGVTLNAYYYN